MCQPEGFIPDAHMEEPLPFVAGEGSSLAKPDTWGTAAANLATG